MPAKITERRPPTLTPDDLKIPAREPAEPKAADTRDELDALPVTPLEELPHSRAPWRGNAVGGFQGLSIWRC